MSTQVDNPLARAALVIVCAAFFALAFSRAALALPTHSRLPALDVTGLNHACGVATDSKGDLYASSAAASKVLIFGPTDHETPIGELADANEPCGLTLTGTGTLYVSEAKTGEVVRFKPTVYPFLGAPSYGPREVIDSSGQAKGISVDPFDDRLYVAEGTRVTAYDSEGKLGVDEVQEALCFGCDGGEYKLEFAGEETEPIPFEAEAKLVEERLLALAAFEPGDVSVINGSNKKSHLITFEGKYAHTDVEAFTGVPFTIKGEGTQKVIVSETIKGFSGHIGEGRLSEATGLAAYTYEATGFSFTYHLAVADAASDQLKLFSARSFKAQKLRRTLDGPQAGEEFGFGASGAYLAADPGTCPPGGGKACTAGHFLLYDDANEVLDELEADGELVFQTPFAFGDGVPTAIATDRSGGANNGTLYATSGSGAGARALAFAPLGEPSRPGPLAEPLSLTQAKTCSVAIDSSGDRYVAVGPEVFVYPPTGSTPLAKIAEESGSRCRIAVDSEGNVYALLKEKVAYFKPSSFPPKAGTTYGAAVTVAKESEFAIGEPIAALAVNPANGHLLVTSANKTIEYDSALNGSALLNSEIGAGLGISSRVGVAAYGTNGDLYISTGSGNGSVFVLDSTGKEVLTRITGRGSPAGSFGADAGAIAVDQSNGHVIVFETYHEDVEEYEASGAFVTAFGSASPLVTTAYGVAVDNGASSPNKGDVYLAFDDTMPETFDLTAFGALGHGEAPAVATDPAAEVSAGNATLRGSVDPRGVEVEECRFEYASAQSFEEEGFAGAEGAPCEPAEIGKGTEPVPVEAKISGLEPEGRYRFRLLAANEYGTGESDPPGLFGRPQATAQTAQPVFYDEATLRAQVNPWGLAGSYRFEYVDQAHFETEGFEGAATRSTPEDELAPGEDPVAVSAPLSGLVANTLYHFRIVAENEAGSDVSEGQFTTLEEQRSSCPNAALRTGPSANLPDCRAYELVTPARDNGYPPFWGDDGNFPTALAAAGGGSMVFETEGPLPGTEGNGVRNGYLAKRGASGWAISLYGPTYAQTDFPNAGGVSADQRYSFWTAQGETGALDPTVGNYARYLSLPEPGADPACSPEPGGRFELIGCGSEGTDPEAIGRFISPGAGHVIFTSEEKLEPDVPAKGTLAIYDRSPGGPTHVVSLLPGDKAASTSAIYRGVSADGSAVAFDLGEPLYMRRDNTQTLEVGGSASFAGLARDGSSLFYLKGGALFRFDAEKAASTQIASGGGAAFVNIAADGTAAYFTSTEKLAPGAKAGEHNLYRWEAQGDTTSFVAALAPSDLEGNVSLAKWVKGLDPEANGVLSGPAIDPSRSSADGTVLLFQSHAPLTGYESQGYSEVFRYDATNESLICISCGPAGTVAHSDALLQDEAEGSPILSALAPIANLSTDGKTAFFTSSERLLPTDRNGVADVYGWRDGRLSLISTGKSAYPSYLYAVSATGDDVFFATREGLVPQDAPSGSSIYDARVDGGFPTPVEGETCAGEACLETPSTPPDLKPPFPTASAQTEELVEKRPRFPHRCPKGKRKVRRSGKVHCVKRHRARRHRHRRAAR